MKLKGDTLIEVALAIGIFSLVAITVVSVVSASTSSAQSALETTLTREEIDAQAEALRFIHESYISGNQGADKSKNPYKGLWTALTENAASEEDIADYNPTTCSDVFKDGKVVYGNVNRGKTPSFILNIRKLNSKKPEDVIIVSDDEHKKFQVPVTYPRILYGTTTKDLDRDKDKEDLSSQANIGEYTEIKAVEGLYIIAAKGEHSIVKNSVTKDRPAYFDFYIRSCWTPLGTDRASTVSTVVRLYDPEAIDYKN